MKPTSSIAWRCHLIWCVRMSLAVNVCRHRNGNAVDEGCDWANVCEFQGLFSLCNVHMMRKHIRNKCHNGIDKLSCYYFMNFIFFNLLSCTPFLSLSPPLFESAIYMQHTYSFVLSSTTGNGQRQCTAVMDVGSVQFSCYFSRSRWIKFWEREEERELADATA